jgi:hypothetical protein
VSKLESHQALEWDIFRKGNAQPSESLVSCFQSLVDLNYWDEQSHAQDLGKAHADNSADYSGRISH